MPFWDAFGIRYGKNGEETVGDALDELFENRTWDGEVDFYTELPTPAIDYDGQTYYVKKYTLLSPIRLTGLYFSTGGAWKRRSDKVTYTLNNFTATNKLVKTADTKGQVIETPIEIDSNDDLDLKDNNIQNLGYAQFDITQVAPTPAEGKLVWSDTEGTLNLGMKGGDVNQQIGLELFLRAKAVGSAISNGDIVYVSGASGSNPEMSLARADLLSTSECTIAVATEDILENALGYYTTFGKVREIDTSSFPAGSLVYLSDTVAGAMTLTKPSAPSNVVEVGIILNQNVNEGVINVRIKHCEICLDRDVQKEPTGFTDPEDVVITGDGTTRTITLSGTVVGYHKGVHITALESGWESPAHTDDTNPYYLIYDGSSFQWVTPQNFQFYYLLIAFTFYANGTNERVYSRECHGLMPWQSHLQFHALDGTYRQSGGDMADYVLSSTTATDRRPSISSTSVVDEDLKTINALLASDSNYTQHYLSGAGATSNFATTPVDIVPLSGNQPYWNEFTGGSWQQTLMSNNYYMSIWVIAIPVGASTTSQKYRYVSIQGQIESITLSVQQNLNPADVNLGDLTTYAPEFIFFKQIIIRYQGGNWTFQEVVDLTGTRSAQVGSPAGNFLTAVTSDTTLTGDGTASSPLGFALNNSNTWSVSQTFSAGLIAGSLSLENGTISEFSLNILTVDVLYDLDDSTLKIVNTGGGGVCRVGINEASPETIQEITHTEPYITLHNSTHEDTDGGRESRINFKGEQSGGEETTLARIQASHDGTSDDEKADLIFYTNDGSDGSSPTERMRIDSGGVVNIGGNPTTKLQKLAVVGTVSSDTDGPHVNYYVSNDLVYPVLQNLNFAHDNINFAFDAYLDTTWKSSDAGSNFLMAKSSDTFGIFYNAGTALGNTLTWTIATKIDSTGKFYSIPTYNNGVSGGRDVYVQSSGQFSYNTSSLESKINIAPLTDWENIYNLQPVNYNNRLKDENGNYTSEHDGILDRGLIADDVNTYYPEIVYKDPILNELEEVIGEKIVGMDYKKLIPDMIKCIQDLKARITILEGE
jgi:hypothetical protein